MKVKTEQSVKDLFCLWVSTGHVSRDYHAITDSFGYCACALVLVCEVNVIIPICALVYITFFPLQVKVP